MSTDQKVDEKVMDSVERLIRQALLAKTSELARKGRYDEAEALLSDVVQAGQAHPALLDMLARIHAQQRHFARAESLWTSVSGSEPENGDYAAALRRIAVFRNHPIRAAIRRFVMSGGIAGFCILIVAMVWYGGFIGKCPQLSESPGEPLIVSSPVAESDSLAELDARLAQYVLFEKEVFAQLEALRRRDTEGVASTINQAALELKELNAAAEALAEKRFSLFRGRRRDAIQGKINDLEIQMETLRSLHEALGRPYDDVVSKLEELTPKVVEE